MAGFSAGARLFNEARAVNSVRHPSLAQISEFGQLPDGCAFLVMEYLDGETLSARLRHRGGMLSEPEALWVAAQLAAVLSATHAQGVVHRDLKPGSRSQVTNRLLAGWPVAQT